MRVGMLGAGAIGVPLGFFLSTKNKNDVVFLARESSVSKLERDFHLLSYDKNTLETFTVEKVLSTGPLLDGTAGTDYGFDVVVVTIPTDVLYTESGQKLIESLSKAKEGTCFLVLSPGYTVYDSVFKKAGVDKKNVVFGLPLFLSHEVKKVRFEVGEKFEANLDKADIAFHMLWNSKRVALISGKPKNLRKVLNSCGKGGISLGVAKLELGTAMFLLLNLLLEVQDYPRKLRKDATFKAAMKAWKAITKEYGSIGWLSRKTAGKGVFRLTDSLNRKYSKPLGTEFLKYHHAGKVKEQNLSVLEKYGGQEVTAFATLCREK